MTVSVTPTLCLIKGLTRVLFPYAVLLRVLDLVFPFLCVLKVPVCVFGGGSALQMQGPLIKVDTVAGSRERSGRECMPVPGACEFLFPFLPKML